MQGGINMTDSKKLDLILDEVERVHAILDSHKADKAVHTA